MDVVFWVCAVAGVALLVVGIVADGTIVEVGPAGSVTDRRPRCRWVAGGGRPSPASSSSSCSP